MNAPQVVVLSGGRGTRMARWTREVPKALIPVCGRPFLAWQLEWLAGNGVERAVISVGYRGEMIEEFAAESNFGLDLRCVREPEQSLLGTGGALVLAGHVGALDDSFLLLYGDSYLPMAVMPFWESFCASGRPGALSVWRNENRRGRSNIVFDGELVRAYDKVNPGDGFDYIDYGLSAFARSEVVAGRDCGEPWDLGELLQRLAGDGKLGGYEVGEQFFEIGTEEGLAELEGRLCRGGPG